MNSVAEPLVRVAERREIDMCGPHLTTEYGRLIFRITPLNRADRPEWDYFVERCHRAERGSVTVLTAR